MAMQLGLAEGYCLAFLAYGYGLAHLGVDSTKVKLKIYIFLCCGDCELIESVVPSDELDRASLSAGNVAEAGGGALPGIPGLLLEGGLEKSEPKDLYLRCGDCELSESIVPSDELDGKSAGNAAEAGRGVLLGPGLGCGPEKWDSIKLCLNCECSGCVVQSDELDGKSLFAGNAAEAGRGAFRLERGLEKRDSIKLCLNCESSRCIVQSDKLMESPCLLVMQLRLVEGHCLALRLGVDSKKGIL